MLAQRRHELILEAVRREGAVRVRDLAAELDVSDMTVRRDLDTLAERRLVEKVHGGAVSVSDHSAFEPGFDVKQLQETAEKDAIAAAALSRVTPNSAIGLTAGTTTWRLGALLGTIADLTVVTNAPAIARTLYELHDPGTQIVLTGGVRTPSDALVGPLATAALASLHVDVLFLGVHGFDPERGFSTPNLAEAEVNRAFIDAARRVVVLADHTKWALRGLAQIAPLDAVDTVISDAALPPHAVDALESAGVEVVLVPVDGADAETASTRSTPPSAGDRR